MVLSFDGVLDFLLERVALSGRKGASREALGGFLEEFFGLEATCLPHDAFKLAEPRQNIDEYFQNSVWGWLSEHPDIQLVHNEGDSMDSGSDRICAKKEYMWQAIAGHEVDHVKIPTFEFDLLCIIAAHGVEGIPQSKLRALSGQDKRSVPKRTDALAEKGYILKRPFLFSGSTTSLCTLRKFVTDTAISKIEDTATEKATDNVREDNLELESTPGDLKSAIDQNVQQSEQMLGEQDIIHPKWSPDYSFNNTIFEITDAAGPNGIKTNDLIENSFGSWHRPAEQIIARLTNTWQDSQPSHLRHLAIIRDVALIDKVSQYIYRTFRNHQAAVDADEASWEAVMNITRIEDNQTSSLLDAADTAGFDKWGFPKVPAQRLTRHDGSSTLSECQKILNLSEENEGSKIKLSSSSRDKKRKEVKKSLHSPPRNQQPEPIVQLLEIDKPAAPIDPEARKGTHWQRWMLAWEEWVDCRAIKVADDELRQQITGYPVHESLNTPQHERSNSVPVEELGQYSTEGGGSAMNISNQPTNLRKRTGSKINERLNAAKLRKQTIESDIASERHNERVQEIRAELISMKRPGVYINPPSTFKMPKQGRPRLTLVVVIITDKLRSLEWFKTSTSLIQSISNMERGTLPIAQPPTMKPLGKSLTPKKRGVLIGGGFVAQKRSSIILDILDEAGGAYPGNDELWYPFVTAWSKLGNAQDHRPDKGTVKRAAKSLIDSGKIKRFIFSFQAKSGNIVTKQILAKSDIEPDSEQVKSLENSMINAHPRPYLPEQVPISAYLIKKGSKIDSGTILESTELLDQQNQQLRSSSTEILPIGSPHAINDNSQADNPIETELSKNFNTLETSLDVIPGQAEPDIQSEKRQTRSSTSKSFRKGSEFINYGLDLFDSGFQMSTNSLSLTNKSAQVTQKRPASGLSDPRPKRKKATGKIKKLVRPGKDAPLNLQTFHDLIVVVSLVKILTGGVERTTDWGLVKIILNDTADALAIRSRYNYHLRTYYCYINRLETAVEESFLTAYSNDEIPCMDFENIKAYDWDSLILWAKCLVSVEADEGDMKDCHDRKSLEQKFIISAKSCYEPPVDDLYTQFVSTARREEIMAECSFTIPLRPMERSETEKSWISTSRPIGVVESHVRANILTPHVSYNPTTARNRLLSFDESLLENTVEQMIFNEILRQKSRGENNSSRDYVIPDRFLHPLTRAVEAKGTLQAATRHEKTLRNPPALYDWIELSFHAKDSELIPTLDLIASNDIDIEVVLPEVTEDETEPEDDSKLSVWGFTVGNYKTSQMNRTELLFNIRVSLPNETNQFRLLELPPPPCPQIGHPGEPIPIWCDIHDQILPNMWNSMIAIVSSMLVQRPGTTTDAVVRKCKPLIGDWEVELIFQWLLTAGIIRKLGDGYMAVPGWWKVFGLGQPKDVA